MPSTFGLRAKLTLLIESLIVVLVLITGTVSILREKRTLEVELHKRGLAVAFDLAKFTARPMISQDLPTLRRFVNHTMEQDYVLYVMLQDPKGKVVMHSDLDKVGKIIEPKLYDLDRETQLSRRNFTQFPEQDELHCDLSAREYQVVLMIAAGKTVGQIAEELYLSVKTISTNRTRALRKMGMNNNSELTYYAMKHDLIR
jgi:DNA-binding CsgD family transcriptional regulator